MKLKVKVKPSSRKDQVIKELDGTYKIKIKAPPVEGKANAYLITFLASVFDIPRTSIILLKGTAQANKLLEIEGSEERVHELLGEYINRHKIKPDQPEIG